MLHDVHRRRTWRAALRGAAAIGATLALHPAGAAAAPSTVTGAGTPVAAAAAGGCSHAGATLATASVRRLRAAALCLVNRRRAEHGVRRLRRESRLERAAGRHAADMRRRGYFAHTGPGGPTLLARLQGAGWAGVAWGEVLAFGCGGGGSPRSVVRMWMRSPGHRAIMLSPAYRRAGIGIAPSRRCRRGVTWVMDVGRG